MAWTIHTGFDLSLTRTSALTDQELPPETSDQPTAEELISISELLQRIADDRGLLAILPKEQRDEFLKRIGIVANPSRRDRRKLSRVFRQRKLEELAQRKNQDRQRLAETGIRSQAGLPQFPTPKSPYSNRQLQKSGAPQPFEPPLPPKAEETDAAFPIKLDVPRNCYTCKRDFQRVHFFYDSLCPDCATLNWQKRIQTCDLSGRIALVTGGRVKIGYQAAIKLLRAGAQVIVATRFPRDAANRFLAEDDSDAWYERLQVHGIDLRHTPSVESLSEHLCTTLPRLDFILNNACQTVRRPPGFYSHLMDEERRLGASLSEQAQLVLQSHDTLCRESNSLGGAALSGIQQHQMPTEVIGSLTGIQQAAELSQIPLLNDDETDDDRLFPAGRLDQDLQ
ncbi:MAG: SDR family NAD(P)-dependent oxidoreductase, partial [Planctomycetales bacterium]|nr:SDR family NAD(P)-dependent oxidoreductase [Planctomycetales bacterium]